MSEFLVEITKEAEDDIFDVYKFVSIQDGVQRAEKLFEQLEKKCFSLIDFPSRGHSLPELDRLEIGGYLEIHFKPYRIIYQIQKNIVYVHAVLDGRRNMQDILQKRLIR